MATGLSRNHKTAGGVNRRLPFAFITICLCSCLFLWPITTFANFSLRIVVTPDFYQLGLQLFYETAVFFFMAYVLGEFVISGKLHVNYSRKILQAIIFFVPVFASFITPHYITKSAPSNFDLQYPYSEFGKNITIYDPKVFIAFVLTGVVVLLWTYAFSPKVTGRFRLFKTCFASIDRPEDRPMNLVWLRTEIIATYIIIVIFMYFSGPVEKLVTSQILLVSIFVSGIGDALSGIIGFRFGKRHYKVRALFTKKEYTRTWEGSACIFMSAVLAISCVFFPRNANAMGEYLALLAIVPAIMTLAEAKSPHSWDNPFIVLSGIVSISLVLFGLDLISG